MAKVKQDRVMKKIFVGKAAVLDYYESPEGLHVTGGRFVNGFETLLGGLFGLTTIADLEGDTGEQSTISPEDLAALPGAPSAGPNLGQVTGVVDVTTQAANAFAKTAEHQPLLPMDGLDQAARTSLQLPAAASIVQPGVIPVQPVLPSGQPNNAMPQGTQMMSNPLPLSPASQQLMTGMSVPGVEQLPYGAQLQPYANQQQQMPQQQMLPQQQMMPQQQMPQQQMPQQQMPQQKMLPQQPMLPQQQMLQQQMMLPQQQMPQQAANNGILPVSDGHALGPEQQAKATELYNQIVSGGPDAVLSAIRSTENVPPHIDRLTPDQQRDYLAAIIQNLGRQGKL